MKKMQIMAAGIARFARIQAAVVCALLICAVPTYAQDTTAPVSAPEIKVPGLRAYATENPDGALARGDFGEIALEAHLAEGAEIVSRGMHWRVFKPDPGDDGKLPLVASSQGGAARFQLEPGSYLIHAAFGRAGATKRITIAARERRNESVILDAGGLKLDAMLSGSMRIPADKLRFSIYEAEEDENGERALIVPNVRSNAVVRLNAGTYHVVSTYGSVNAVIRSDIRVEAGKLTEATVEHRAAQITLKLVRENGGEAIADTSWAVLTDSGDTVRETVGAFAQMVLAEGKYTVVAKNREHIYQREFEVVAGPKQDVEVLAAE